MSILNRVAGLVSQNSQIKHTNVKNIFTKYGIYKAKMYINNGQEYVAIMSLNFFTLENPILYIHSDSHQCNPFDESCGCTNQAEVVLSTISREGGVLIYTSKDAKDIDIFLEDLKTRPLEAKKRVSIGTNFKSALKGYKGEYIALDFIFKDLKLSVLQLVSDSSSVVFILEQLGIVISRQTSMISYAYGESMPASTNETIEKAKALSFTYSNKK